MINSVCCDCDLQEKFDSVTIYVGSVLGFDEAIEHKPAYEVIKLLNQLYTVCDDVIAETDVIKIETIRDIYLVSRTYQYYFRKKTFSISPSLYGKDTTKSPAALLPKELRTWSIPTSEDNSTIGSVGEAIETFLFEAFNER